MAVKDNEKNKDKRDLFYEELRNGEGKMELNLDGSTKFMGSLILQSVKVSLNHEKKSEIPWNIKLTLIT